MSQRCPLPGARCRMIGCDFESLYSDPDLRRRSVNEHLAMVHGIGRIRGSEAHLGCFWTGCDFKVAGSVGYTQDALRAHVVAFHGINPADPRIPRDARRRSR